MDWPLPCGPHGQWLYDHSGQTKELRCPPWSFKALPRGGTPSLGEEDLGQTIQSVHILWKSWCLISTNSLLLFRMALARHPDSSKHRRLVYRCTSCSYFGDQRALQAHVVTRQVPLEEAPNFFRVRHIKYVQADHWVRHANSNSQRVRVMVCPSPGGGGRPRWGVALGPSTSLVHALMPPTGGAKRANASSNTPDGLGLGPPSIPWQTYWRLYLQPLWPVGLLQSQWLRRQKV